MKIPQFGENVYKQVTVDGKKVNKWLQLSCIQKFDENGNLIFQNDNGYEKWFEYNSHNAPVFEKSDDGEEKSWNRKYDSDGNLIWFEREWSGYKCWRDFDENGNCIHQKDSDYNEKWFEYDSNNNLIHMKKDNGFEVWKEYDENGNLIHTSDTDEFEKWYDNDSNGKCIHWKDSNGDEAYFEYDENGHMIHKINPDGSEFWFEIECHENGKIKLSLSYCRI